MIREFIYNLSERLTKLNTVLAGFVGIIAIINSLFFLGSHEIIANKPQSFNVNSGEIGIFVSDNLTKPVQVPNSKITGGPQGIFVSEVYMKPLVPTNTGIEKGIEASDQYLQDKTMSKAYAFNALVLLEEIQNTLAIDVQKEVSDEFDRGKELQRQLDNLRDFKYHGDTTIARLGELRSEAETEFESATNQANEKEKEFFQEFDNYRSVKAEMVFDEYLDAKKMATEKKADLGVLLSLEERFNFALPKLNERIIAIENNREAIILGIKLANSK